MKRISPTLRVGALGLLLLACLLVTTPARIAGWLLPPGQLVMQGFSGTLWQGKASRVLVLTPAGYVHLGALDWRLDPWSLLLLAPRIKLESKWGNQAIATSLVLRGGADLDLYDLDATVPADLLQQFMPVSLAGMFALQLNPLKLREGLPVEGAGRLVWQAASWSSPTGPVALGSYAVDISQAAGEPMQGQVITLEGEVAASGSVQLDGLVYGVDITVQGEGGLDERLQQALALLAQPVDAGFRIKLDGEFQPAAGGG